MKIMRKRNKTHIKKICLAAVCICMLAVAAGCQSVEGTGNKSEKPTVSFDKEEISIVLKGATAEGPAGSVSIDKGKVTVLKAGTYRISGTFTDRQVVVDVGDNDDVVLIFDGVDICNLSDAAVYVKNADNVTIYLAEGTQNTIRSGEAVEITDDTKADETAAGGALYSKDDLLIDGEGSLVVEGYINNGIQCSDDLTVSGGTIQVIAVNNGIKGKDSVEIYGGTIEITAGNDGIKSDNDTEEGRGNVLINDGKLVITANGDGISAYRDLTVYGGELELVTGGGSKESGTKAVNAQTSGAGGGFFWGTRGSGWDMSQEDGESQKGLKAGSRLAVYGGSITVDSYDDSIHCSDTVEIRDGVLSLSSGDDGIHSDNALTILGGTIDIALSYEGLEANQIEISGGVINVAAADDGINANGGTGGMGFFGVSAQMSAEDMPNLIIRGGSIHVNAGGDGLDSNGNLIVEDGTVVIDGPTDNGNGALDYGMESGGKCMISGGTVLALGSSGMAESFSTDSSQCSVRFYCASYFTAGALISIEDVQGNVLYSYEVEKGGNCIIFSSPELKQEESYTFNVGSENAQVVLSSVCTDAGSSIEAGGFGGNPNGGPKGGSSGGQRGEPNGGQKGGPDGGSRPEDGNFPGNFPGMPEGGTPPQVPEDSTT